jgi:hypothetical protein
MFQFMEASGLQRQERTPDRWLRPYSFASAPGASLERCATTELCARRPETEKEQRGGGSAKANSTRCAGWLEASGEPGRRGTREAVIPGVENAAQRRDGGRRGALVEGNATSGALEQGQRGIRGAGQRDLGLTPIGAYRQVGHTRPCDVGTRLLAHTSKPTFRCQIRG